MACAPSNPAASSTLATRTVPVSSFVTARFAPRRTKKVARVTMKDGKPVLTTTNPLMNPTSAAKAKTMGIATHTFKLYSVVSNPARSPEVPTMTPVERSNSPPIIRRATKTAMIPIGAAMSVHPAVPPTAAKFPVVSTLQKRKKMTAAPMSAPNSGRWSNLVARDVCATLSSFIWVAIVSFSLRGDSGPHRTWGGCLRLYLSQPPQRVDGGD